LRDLLITAIKKEKGYIDTAIEYAASRTVMNTFKPKEEEQIKSAKAAEAKAETRTEAKTDAKTEAKTETKTKLNEHIKTQAKIILLDLMMPNGKALRDCTGIDCRKFGGWFGRIADKVGRKKVGDVLSEKEIRNLRKR
jgi:hypothetical protein